MKIDEAQARNDLYQAVNGEWLETAVIPDDKPQTGGFSTLAEEVECLMRADMEKLKAGDLLIQNEEMKQAVAFYRQATQFRKREADGTTPLQAFLLAIKKLKSLSDLQALAEQWIRLGFPLPFSTYLTADMKNAEEYLLYMSPAPSILPDTTYYQEGRKDSERLLAVFGEMSMELFPLFGYDEKETAQLLADTLAFDRLLVPFKKSSQERADYTKAYNARTLDQVRQYSPHLDLKALLETLTGKELAKVSVTEPVYFEAMNQWLNEETFELLKSWLQVQLMLYSVNFLTEEVRQIGNRYQLALNGSKKVMNQEKNAYQLVHYFYGDVLGDYYGKTYFGDQARQDVKEMIQQMIGVYQERLEENDWLTPETIQKAILKLGVLEVLVGYPDQYPQECSALKVDSSKSFAENYLQLAQVLEQQQMAKAGTKVDRKRWGMSADTVNAYFNPTNNVICFPAAILQAPFYSLEQSRSENYGGIGAVIAHEISHSFDNNGSKFDEKGNLVNWWTEEDFAAFNQRAKMMIDQWEGLPFVGKTVNGTLTVSENIADCGGLTCALQALKKEEHPDLKSFFYNWARIWCRKVRQEYAEMLLSIDVHSPGELRANIQPRNMDEFHEAFGTVPGDAMYLEPEKRVRIW